MYVFIKHCIGDIAYDKKRCLKQQNHDCDIVLSFCKANNLFEENCTMLWKKWPFNNETKTLVRIYIHKPFFGDITYD